jgi:hypothetical protein
MNKFMISAFLGITLFGAFAMALPARPLWSCNIVSGEGDLENMDVYQTAQGEIIGGMEYNRPFDDESDWHVGPLEAKQDGSNVVYGGADGGNGYFYLTLETVDLNNLHKGVKARGTLRAFIPAKADPTGFGNDKVGGGSVECTYGIQDLF